MRVGGTRFLARWHFFRYTNNMGIDTAEQQPHNRDQDLPRRRGEIIDDERDKTPERDDIPDTPPTEPEPVPVQDPPPAPETQGPYIVH